MDTCEGNCRLEMSPPGSSAGWGYVHSWDSMGVQDGPGTRFVLFLTGCPLRCAYCHNPDTWHLKNGRLTSLEEIVAEIAKFRRILPLMHGGITISGGEPLVQRDFTAAVLRRCREMGLHTALDTSGFLGDRVDEAMLADIDLVLLDIKAWTAETARRVTHHDIMPTLRFARRLAEAGKRIWLRFVLVPGLTDDPAEIASLARFAKDLGAAVERIDVLPFHQMGKGKWHALDLLYQLEDTPPASAEQAEAARRIFRAEGLHAVY